MTQQSIIKVPKKILQDNLSNGKIYIGKDLTDTLDILAAPTTAFESDFSDEQRRVYHKKKSLAIQRCNR